MLEGVTAEPCSTSDDEHEPRGNEKDAEEAEVRALIVSRQRE